MKCLYDYINFLLAICRSGRFPSLCNTQKVDLDPLLDEDYTTLKHIVQDHYHHTQSAVAKVLLDNWSENVRYFIKVSTCIARCMFASLE